MGYSTTDYSGLRGLFMLNCDAEAGLAYYHAPAKDRLTSFGFKAVYLVSASDLNHTSPSADGIYFVRDEVRHGPMVELNFEF